MNQLCLADSKGTKQKWRQIYSCNRNDSTFCVPFNWTELTLEHSVDMEFFIFFLGNIMLLYMFSRCLLIVFPINTTQ